jgi:hypothetical protein
MYDWTFAGVTWVAAAAPTSSRFERCRNPRNAPYRPREIFSTYRGQVGGGASRLQARAGSASRFPDQPIGLRPLGDWKGSRFFRGGLFGLGLSHHSAAFKPSFKWSITISWKISLAWMLSKPMYALTVVCTFRCPRTRRPIRSCLDDAEG